MCTVEFTLSVYNMALQTPYTRLSTSTTDFDWICIEKEEDTVTTVN